MTMSSLDMICPSGRAILQASDLGTSAVSVTVENLYFFLSESLGLSILSAFLVRVDNLKPHILGFFCFFVFLVFLPFPELLPWHMEVPRLGVESEL